MITVICSTKSPSDQFKEEIIKSSGLQDKLEFIFYENKGEFSLTELYNRGLNEAKYNHIVYLHDDISIETKQWGKKLLKQFEKNPEYGIIGVAGTKYMPVSGQWWEDRKKMYGRVAHTHEGKTWLSAYSPDLHQELEEVVIVDGVFFAIDKTKIKEKFDETFKGFHFYDVSFSFENHLKGVKIGVTTMIRVNHKSIGMTNEAWDENRKQFAEKFKNNLPVTIKRKLRKGERLKVLIGCLDFKDNTPEEKYILDLIKTLKDNDCEISLTSNVDKKKELYLKQLGVKVYSLQQPPGFVLGDGKWKLKIAGGEQVSQPNTLYKLHDLNFDVLHINKKPVADHLLRLFPDTNVIATIHTTDKSLDEPVRNNQIKKYLAVNDEIKEILIDGYGIDANNVDTTKNINIIEEYKAII